MEDLVVMEHATHVDFLRNAHFGLVDLLALLDHLQELVLIHPLPYQTTMHVVQWLYPIQEAGLAKVERDLQNLNDHPLPSTSKHEFAGDAKKEWKGNQI